MNRASCLAASFLSGLISISAFAQAGKPGGEGPAAGVKPVQNPVSNEELRKILRIGVQVIDEVEDEFASLKQDDDARIRFMISDDGIAATLQAIGAAQAKVGDRKGALETWKRAIEATSKLSDPWEAIDILLAIADARTLQREPDAALAVLKVATSYVRAPDREPDRDLMASIDVLRDSNTGGQRAHALRLIGLAQIKAGDREAARSTFRRAIEEAETIVSKNVRVKLETLAELATAQSPADAEATWAKAIQIALTLPEEYERSRGVEIMLRIRVRAGQYAEVLRTIDNQFKGVLALFALWVVTDEASRIKPAATPKIADQLEDRINKAAIDDRMKKQKLLAAIARVRSASGDHVGVERIFRAMLPYGTSGTTSFVALRLDVAKLLAEAQIAAGDRASAKETLQAASKFLASIPFDSEGTSQSSWHAGQLAELQAKVGDVSGAQATAASLPSSSSRARTFTKIAEIQAKSGDREASLRTLKRVSGELAGIDTEDLWERSVSTWRLDRPDTVKAYQFRRMSDDLQIERLPSGRSEILQEMAEVQAIAGDLDTAYRTIDSIPKNDVIHDRRRVLCGVGKAQAKSGDFDGALRTAERIESDRDSFNMEIKELIEFVARTRTQAGDAGGMMRWVTSQKNPVARLSAVKGLAEGIVGKD